MQSQQPTHPLPAPTKPKTSRGKKALLIVIGLIVLFIVFGMIGSKSDTNNTAKTTASSNQQTQSQPTQPTTAQQVVTWRDKYGYIFQTLTSDFTKTEADSQDSSNPDQFSNVRDDCNKIKTDVTTAQGFPAIPDAQTASDYSSSLSYYSTGAQDCIDGITNSDTSLIEKGASEFAQGNTKTEAAVADLKKLTNQ